MRVQQKQIAVLQAIIVEGRGVVTARFNIKVVKLPIFNIKVSKVGEFIISYRLYLKMRIRRVIVKEQIQWILLYVLRGLADIWKENLLEDLKLEKVKFGLVEEFLLELKKKFSREDKKLVKVPELKKIE